MRARVKVLLMLAAGACLAVPAAKGQTWYLSGQVLMEDGSPPPKPVTIERYCGVNRIIREAVSDRKGRYQMRLLETGSMTSVSRFTIDGAPLGIQDFLFMAAAGRCVLRASLAGYVSNVIDLTDRRPTDDPHLTPLVLHRPRPETEFSLETGPGVPKAARKAWERAMKAVGKKDWAEAERQLRPAVEANPQFSQGWHLLGTVCQNQKKAEEARAGFEHAIESDPKSLGPYVLLARLNVAMEDWDAALKTSEGLIKADTRRRYPEAYVQNAVARYHRHDLDGAEKSAREAVRLDKKHLLPRAEYVLGLVLAAKRDYTAAAEHLRQYLAWEPKAGDAEAVRTRIANLGKPEAAQPAPELDKVDLSLPPAGEAWVPGGLKALAAAAHTGRPASYEDFFSDYCRARVRLASPGSTQSLTGYLGSLRAYFAAMAELAYAGERRTERTVITLSLADERRRKDTERVLALLGWKAVMAGGSMAVEPGDQALDSSRQTIPALLGIDEIAMQEALGAGKTFTFEIPSESARLIGGDVWNGFIRANQALPGGLAEAFVRDLRLAKLYAGLSEMGTETAAALVAAVGLRTLVLQHADLLGSRAGAFGLRGGAVAVPGGARTEAVWTKLAGASPRDPQSFFRALFGRDRGRLAAFYATVAQSDALHQRFFTKTEANATRFYGLFRNPYEIPRRGEKPHGTWPPSFFEDLPLDAGGNVRFPGGRQAWPPASGTDEDALVALGSPEPLIALARLERNRRAPLDEGSARLLARHYAEWQSLFPYFERLPGLGSAEFEALEAFAAAAHGYEPAKRNQVVGEWHALVELIALGAKAGSLEAGASARVFRRACQALQARDFSAQALETLRAMAGRNGTLDQAAANLLRLGGAERAAFERVRALQNVPRLEGRLRTPDDDTVLHALGGLVYAAWLNPEGLLVSEDPMLVRKHRFVEREPQAGVRPLFEPAELQLSTVPPGSYFSGGFANFGEVARKLPRGGESAGPAPAEPVAGGAPVAASPGEARVRPAGAVFRADARLVEVPATVTDARGRYIDGLSSQQFLVLDEGQPQPVSAFESNTSSLTCALLLDTTGSMQAALPALKNAAWKLIGELREGDSVAVYSFNETVSVLQPFTTDKRAAMRAVLRTYPDGMTALYDALTRVGREIAGRSGKKAIIVFTDGSDNTSSLTAEAAIQRAKIVGAPVYAVAQGDALRHPLLLKQLTNISVATGGLPFSIRDPRQIGSVFESVAKELKHGYLLAYRPPPVKEHQWRRIEVQLAGLKPHKVRAREGYYPQ